MPSYPKHSIKHLAGYPFVWMVRLLSWLPLNLLYRMHGFWVFLLADLIGYRKKMVMENLRYAFPEKTLLERKKIAKGFYRHLGEVVAESVKTLNLSEKEMRKRVRLSDQAEKLVEAFMQKRQSVICLMGHLGNWEWAISGFNLDRTLKMLPVYRPLKNEVANSLIVKMRSRYAREMIKKSEVAQAMARYQREDKQAIFTFVADQSPRKQKAYWTRFLSQDTPVFAGPEKLARIMKMPVCFATMRREKRGHYLLDMEILCEKPWELTDGELSQLFMSSLEREIHRDPASWLWSHNRWKDIRAKKKPRDRVTPNAPAPKG